MNAAVTESEVVLTVGHSSRSLDELIDMLHAHGVTRVVDVRTVPRSRKNPQFNRETFPAALAAAGIGYLHMIDLGGLRKPRKDSPNTGWENDSFRGFADYMQTPPFQHALDELIQHAAVDRVAILCAEAVPWRCHRMLIADALTARGIHVEHIMDPRHRRPHEMTRFAHVVDGKIIYR